MSIEREQLVEALWIAAVNNKYVGVRMMKAIAQEIIKAVPNGERNTKKWFFVEYKKSHGSEWFQWSDSSYSYKLYVSLSIIQLSIYGYLEENDEEKEIELLTFDRNLNLRFSNNDTRQAFEQYQEQFKSQFNQNYDKYYGTL